MIIFYSFSYISHYENRSEYFAMVVLFLGSMMGLVFSSNLIYLFVFWEITSFASWRLIGFFREPRTVLKADKAFLVTVFGALVMLAGFILIYQQAGSFDLLAIKAALAGKPMSNLAVVADPVGHALQVGDAAVPHVAAGRRRGALAGDRAAARGGAGQDRRLRVRAAVRGDVAVDAGWHTVVLVIAAASALVSAGAAMMETDIKRIIAYSHDQPDRRSSFSALRRAARWAWRAACSYILMHGVAKGGLFLCAGIVEQETHTKDITKMGGLGQDAA